jgi:2'-5' RNA ligase
MPKEHWETNSIRDLRFLGTAGLPPKTEAPHITLLDSFSSPDRMEEARRLFTEAAQTVEPFTITLKTLKYFEHKARGFTLYLDPEMEPTEDGHYPLSVLQERLYNNYRHADWLEFKTPPSKFTPHVSLGKVSTKEELDDIMRRYGENWTPITFEVKEIYLMSKLVHDTVVRFAIPLGAKPSLVREPLFEEHSFPPGNQYSININWIPPYSTEDDVCGVFRSYRPVSAQLIFKNLGSDSSYIKGWGNVIFETKADRDRALLDNSFYLRGKKLEIFPCD